MLATHTGANRLVVELFAYFHDARRTNENRDEGHGARGAVLARQLQGKLIRASDDEMDLLCYACEHHSDGILQGDPTVLTSWDADRLDRGRVGIDPNPRYLCTEAARNDVSLTRANRRAQSWRDGYDARPERSSLDACAVARAHGLRP